MPVHHAPSAIFANCDEGHDAARMPRLSSDRLCARFEGAGKNASILAQHLHRSVSPLWFKPSLSR
jgi:hypothetical protein